MVTINNDQEVDERLRALELRAEQRRLNLEFTLGNFFSMVSGHPIRARDREINFVTIMTNLVRDNRVHVFDMEIFEDILSLIVAQWCPLEFNRTTPTPESSETDTASEESSEAPIEIELGRGPRTPSRYDTSEDEDWSSDEMREL